MPLDTMEDLFEEQLQDVYSAENQLLKALPKMAQSAHAPELRAAFENHLDETRRQIERLEQIAKNLELELQGKTCKAMAGLIAEGNETMEEEGDEDLLDVALAAASQRIEHYEIAAYGTLRALALELDQTEVADLLDQSLTEEQSTDDLLTDICQNVLLEGADQEMEEDEDEDEDEGDTEVAGDADGVPTSALADDEEGEEMEITDASSKSQGKTSKKPNAKKK